jgi:hypothetical protein
MRTETTRRTRERLGLAPGEDERTATAVLGGDHTLARLLARRRTLTLQIAITSVPVVLAAIGTMRAVDSAPLVLAAAILVEVALLAAIPFVRSRTHEVTHELLAEGEDGTLAIPVVRDESRRLRSGRERERLARSLEKLLHASERLEGPLPEHRVPLGVRTLRFAARETREVIALLRADTAAVRGVALVTMLLRDGASPLYGHDPRPLREELTRIRYLLAGPVPAAAAA